MANTFAQFDIVHIHSLTIPRHHYWLHFSKLLSPLCMPDSEAEQGTFCLFRKRSIAKTGFCWFAALSKFFNHLRTDMCPVEFNHQEAFVTLKSTLNNLHPTEAILNMLSWLPGVLSCSPPSHPQTQIPIMSNNKSHCNSLRQHTNPLQHLYLFYFFICHVTFKETSL